VLRAEPFRWDLAEEFTVSVERDVEKFGVGSIDLGGGPRIASVRF
jgi:hypothetical protein